MRILRLIIISIVVLFIIITIISLFIPADVRVSKAVFISAPKETVMRAIMDPVNWKGWYPSSNGLSFWPPNGRPEGIELDNSPGHEQLLLIREIKQDEVVAQFQGLGKGSRIIPTGWKILNESNGGVTLEWYISFHLRWYPWEKFTSFTFERIYNPQLQQGLDNLKSFLENRNSTR